MTHRTMSERSTSELRPAPLNAIGDICERTCYKVSFYVVNICDLISSQCLCTRYHDIVWYFQTDIELWLTEMLDSVAVHDKVKDAVIPRTERLCEVVASFVSHCSPLGVVKQFYHTLGVNYYRVVAFNTDRKVDRASLHSL